MNNKTMIFGPPGTGKTFSLIQEIKKLLKIGYHQKDIVICSFSKSAAREISERVSKDLNIDAEEFKYCGTIHSICYSDLKDEYQVIKPKHKINVCNHFNIEFNKEESPDEDNLNPEPQTIGGKLFTFFDIIRLKGLIDLRDIKNEKELINLFNDLIINDEIQWGDINDIRIGSVYSFLKYYISYKEENKLIDFSDMLINTYRNKINVDAKILIVDEFQDLTPLLYEIIKIWKENKRCIFAGDDDQTIYSYMGANPEFMLKEADDAETINLVKSYRLKSNVMNFSQKIIKNNKIRKDKHILPIEEGGDVKFIDIHKFQELINGPLIEKYFILTRTNYYKNRVVEILNNFSIPYYYIKGNSIWNEDNINFWNSLIKLKTNKEINNAELIKLIDRIPSKPYLVHGIKTKIKSIASQEIYSLEKLSSHAIFTLRFFIDSIEDIFNSTLKLPERTKEIFLKHGFNIIEKPKIYIGTVHSSKGKEADIVIYFSDLTYKIIKDMNIEDETRVAYVASSRAKNKLYLIQHYFNDYSIFDYIKI